MNTIPRKDPVLGDVRPDDFSYRPRHDRDSMVTLKTSGEKQAGKTARSKLVAKIDERRLARVRAGVL